MFFTSQEHRENPSTSQHATLKQLALARLAPAFCASLGYNHMETNRTASIAFEHFDYLRPVSLLRFRSGDPLQAEPASNLRHDSTIHSSSDVFSVFGLVYRETCAS